DLASPEQIEGVRRALGLDRPFHIRFGTWIMAILQGDLGTSIYSGLPVTAMIAQRVEATLSLAAFTVLLSVAIAFPLGVRAAWPAGGWPGRQVSPFAVLGFSTPVFVVGYLLVYVFALRAGLFPVQGFVPLSEGIGRHLSHLVLPSLALGTIYIALIAR